ncbi:preprotein translocase subunit TatC [Halolamina sp. CBA1230]|uniref:twin-arginine translocase subunit TatC n=1 Tax=Halolamina sp. CBA1230 TaxID=1853690 RepID=UPI0009A19DED|nr:twin-arginine translocase subunit TatC [Halolamina sp. CBA1230]QKY21162.1 preprotein translocase subunit TatC [Halolamina sp. CBA1230]
MAEEPDDEEGREPSDSSASGSDERSDAERELIGPEEPGSHDNDPASDDEAEPDDDEAEPDDDETEPDDDETEPDDDETEPDDDETEPDDDADGSDDAPAFTQVDGLGPDNEPREEVESDDDSSDDESGDDDEFEAEHVFEDYDPNETPTSPEERGATMPPVDSESETEPGGPEDAGFDPDDGLLGEGPDSDEEMPLAAHIEEMMRRLSVVFIVGGAVALTLLGLGQLFEQVPTAVDIIDILWNNAIPGAPEIEGRRPRVYGPLELVLTKLKVTALAGLLIALPVFVYETYMFMRPGLYPKERRYYISAIPTSLILGTIGMAFSHFVIIPAIMSYFTVYTDENVATVAYGLESTFSLIIVLMGYMAVIFQIPLFIMLAIMMGIVTREWLEDKRLLFWGGFLTIAFLVNPDPTGMTPFIIAATMIVLYEGTLALLRWTGN